MLRLLRDSTELSPDYGSDVIAYESLIKVTGKRTKINQSKDRSYMQYLWESIEQQKIDKEASNYSYSKLKFMNCV